MLEETSTNGATSSEGTPSKTSRGMTVSCKLAIAICVFYSLAGIGLFSGTILSFFLSNGLVCASFLVLYVGIPLAFVVWALMMYSRVIVRRNRRSMIWAGMKYGIVIFGLMGLGFWLVGMIPPTAKTFTLGYWFHAKVWVDVDEIRAWAQTQDTELDSMATVPLADWPPCLRRMPLSYGSLRHNPSTSSTTFWEGGGFGHWGVTVAPKGTPLPDGWCVLKLEDGAWVWHDSQ